MAQRQTIEILKALSKQSRLIIMDESAASLSAKDEIYKILEDLAAGGSAVIMVSSDLQELVLVSTRIIVMRKGSIFTKFAPGALRRTTF